MNCLEHGKLMVVLILLLVAGLGCGSDDPEIVNEKELITTVVLTFTNNGETDEAIMATFRDLDGPGGEDPTTTPIQLNSNSSYTLRVEFLNESETPTEDVTVEVRDEDLEHQVFYLFGVNSGAEYRYGDEDSQGNPIGLTGTLTTSATGITTLTVVLLHEPNKSAAGVAEGNLGAAGGEEDIRVSFSLTVQ